MGAISGASSSSAAQVGTTAASIGGSLLGAGIGAISSKRGQRRAFSYNKALMDYQNQINLQNWRLENEYNSPQNQMARYQAAGLNPNLVAGDVGGSIGAAGDIGSVSPSGTSPSDFAYGLPFAQSLQQLPEVLNSYYTNKNKSYQADRQAMDNYRIGSTLLESVTNDLATLQVALQQLNTQSLRNGVDWLNAKSFFDASGLHGYYDTRTGNGKDFSFDDENTIYRDYVETFRTSVKNNLATALYDSMMHGLDDLSIRTSKGYFEMLKDQYKVQEINAEFEKSLNELDIKEMLKNPGKLLGLIFKALFKVQGVAAPYLLNYQRHKYTSDVMRDYTEERYDPEHGSQVITRLYH